MTKHFGTIWIVGASAGIGAALVEKFAKSDADASTTIIASARSADALSDQAASSKNIHAVPLDVTKPDAVRDAIALIEDRFGLPDLVVLAAGIYSPMPVDDFSAKTIRDHFDVNYFGTVNCLEILIPKMRQRGSGEIAVVASVAGYRGLPKAGAYGPTKAALINLCETLHAELGGTGVYLRVINPGFVKTRLTDKNDFDMPYLQTPEQAAGYVYQGLTRGNGFEIAFPPPFVRQLKLARILPYGLYFKLIRKVMGKSDG
ncbi:SDR family NAD(P)-dependent oxidoreductase [Thalassospira xianhensis]|uniref:Short-chain dehydrogenase n=1 Tax=Thalassospira xianhensis MCCC 1A02616 TaxID=1177929 RepID=A0A367UAY6_9PROT|nr:SDR family NAD(P)-dependent oxidoreductase [Thalassospira xianhensis]RCK05319.1 short-chain dehydrogenase [Thalassospira xianhensis MCCC 1A02616]